MELDACFALEPAEELRLVAGFARCRGGDGNDLGSSRRADQIREALADKHGAVHGSLLQPSLRKFVVAEPDHFFLAVEDRVRVVGPDAHEQQAHRVRAHVDERHDLARGGASTRPRGGGHGEPPKERSGGGRPLFACARRTRRSIIHCWESNLGCPRAARTRSYSPSGPRRRAFTLSFKWTSRTSSTTRRLRRVSVTGKRTSTRWSKLRGIMSALPRNTS